MSFKVICTNHQDHKDPTIEKIPIGAKVTVTSQTNDPLYGKPHYRIAEYPTAANGIPCWYWAGNFSPLSGPCEVAIAESRIAADAAEMDAEWGRIVHELENA